MELLVLALLGVAFYVIHILGFALGRSHVKRWLNDNGYHQIAEKYEEKS